MSGSDETWNPWWGCTRIAPECARCYAAVFASRNLHPNFAGVAAKGDWTGLIIRSSPKVWRDPFRWPPGTLVFSTSMADFWHEAVPLEWLNEALDVIEATPLLHYLLLSKRPGNINRKLAELNRKLPANVWAGATIGHPKSLPLLKPLGRVNASIRFLSVEPLLAPMVPGLDLAGIDWVICGGESGHNPRPCNPEWVRSVRDLCIAHGTPFFFKQWGGTNKKAAGRVLDGRTWDEFPPYS